jgi:uncharacterized membrane protein
MSNNPEKYKWGVFYFDAEDPRVVVPKNIQWMGWTLNFAQPGSYLIVIGLIFLIVIFSTL